MISAETERERLDLGAEGKYWAKDDLFSAVGLFSCGCNHKCL